MQSIKKENTKLRVQVKAQKQVIANCEKEISLLKRMLLEHQKNTLEANIAMEKERKLAIDSAKYYQRVAEGAVECCEEAEEKTKVVKKKNKNLRNKLKELKTKLQLPEEPEPSCEICLQEYSSETKAKLPKLLGCGHTVCRECAEKMMEALPYENNGGRVLRAPGIRCPFDRIPTFLYEDELRTNFALLQIIEGL